MFKTRMILDRGRYYYSMQVKPGIEEKHGLPLECHTLCERNLQRPHFSCLSCRPRRVWYKQMPSKIPVDIITLTVNLNQRHPVLKGMIRRWLCTLIGWTLN